jgi:membrane protein DedA with SNARE-associated domain
MRRATNWRVSVIFGAASIAVVLIAIVYLFTVGFKVAQHRYWKIMDVALVCGMVAAVFAVRYRTVDWHDRPEKRQRLRIGKWLIVLLIALGIPMLVVNWNR